ncbi:MAG TPA: leucine--tRNA ligase, partial [candidate division Zixibacteria bacterium]|nr:leucine--tRNA ligase [candidate division Zixibacteria bacterium]
PFDKEKVAQYMPIDLYVGGITHATGHLIYFRFFQKFLKDLGWVKDDEPAKRLFNHGMVCDSNGEVMSKSKGNVVSPIGLMEERGVDVSRLAMFFTAPSDKEVLWSSDSVTGVEKFAINKLFPLNEKLRNSNPDLKYYFKREELSEFEYSLYIKLNQVIKQVSDSFDKLQFNTAISALMELVRDYDSDKIKNDSFNDYLILKTFQLSAPLVPHLAEEIWAFAGFEGSIFKSNWPICDESAIIKDSIVIGVQINGKLRDEIEIPIDCDQKRAEEVAFMSDKVKKYTDGKEILKIIFVKGRIFNIVVKG